MFQDVYQDIGNFGIMPQEANASGIAQLRLLPADAVLQFNEPSWLRVSSLVFVPGMVFEPGFVFQPVFPNRILRAGDIVVSRLPIDIEIEPDYVLMNEDMATDGQGQHYKVGVSFTIPKDRPDLAYWAEQAANREWIALLKDRNGYFLVVGTKEQPLTLTWNATPGGGRTGRNNRSYVLATDSWTAIYFAEGITDSFLLGAGPYSHEHNENFNL